MRMATGIPRSMPLLQITSHGQRASNCEEAEINVLPCHKHMQWFSDRCILCPARASGANKLLCKRDSELRRWNKSDEGQIKQLLKQKLTWSQQELHPNHKCVH